VKKILLITYFILSIGFLLTLASRLTWESSCSYTQLIPEGRGYSGMCAGDGIQFVGVFLEAIIAASIYVLVTALLLKFLGYKLTKK
jgi:hypothetical protein